MLSDVIDRLYQFLLFSGCFFLATDDQLGFYLLQNKLVLFPTEVSSPLPTYAGQHEQFGSLLTE